MSKNTVLHHKTKHIDVLVYHLRDLIRTNIMTLLKIGTHNMVADTLTKALPAKRQTRYKDCAGVMVTERKP
eukprot:3013153-Rhodomonas_salina.1